MAQHDILNPADTVLEDKQSLGMQLRIFFSS
jgi:hypothetical protein